MGQGHDHGLDTIRHERPLWWALALTGGFLLVELFGAWLSNSLALLSDAAHMATDTLALAVALAAVRLARLPADARRTYGYGRLEALGALFNGGLLLLVAGWILVEAVQRFRQPPEVATTTMLAVAVIGLGVNLAAMRLLKAGAGESLNLRGAYLEVWADMLGSVAVIIGAGLIWATGWRWIDAAVAVGIGLWVLPRTLLLTRDAVHLLLEGVPRHLDADAVLAALRADGGALPGLTAKGFGEAEPVADNGTPEGRAANRRIAFVLIGEAPDPAAAPAAAPDVVCLRRIEAVLADGGIEFAPGSAEIAPESAVVIDGIADALGGCPEVAMEVGGHTDSEGSESGNERLSQQRADAVLAALRARGLALPMVTAHGYGESEPVADNATPEGRAANRRIAFDLMTAEGGEGDGPE
jgi:cobalt-zinc-cadmium efflux system protein